MKSILNTILLCGSLAATLLLGNAGASDFPYRLAFTPDGSLASFNVNVGESVEVPVFLVQTEATQPGGDLMIDGLVSMAVQLNFDTGAENATVSNTTQDTPFFEFQENVIDNDAGVAAFVGAVGFEDPAVTGSGILLGTFTFTGTTGGNVTSVQASIPDALAVAGPYFVSGAQPPVALDTLVALSNTTIRTNELDIVAVFTDRESFDLAVANTVSEDFEESSLLPGETDSSLMVLNSESNGGSFMPGDIEEGLELSSLPGLLFVAREEIEMQTAFVGNASANPVQITLDSGTDSVGFNLREPNNVDFFTIEIIGVSGQVAVFANVFVDASFDNFFGIVTGEEIEQVRVSSAGLIGIDNIVFNRLGDVLLGDINLDGNVNLLDVAPFVELVSSGQFQAEGDTNGDGVVNLLDVGPFIELLSGGVGG